MLETELKKLNANLEKLTAAIEALTPVKDAVYELNATIEAQGPDVPTPSRKSITQIVEEAVGKKSEPEPTPEPTPEPEPEPTPEPTGFTNDDIKSMALAISRKDRSKQRDIKAKLAEHDAKVATDLKGEGLQAVGEWLSALKKELGA